MRNVFIACVVIAGTGQSAFAQSGAWADKLFKGQVTHDFANVPHGAKLSYRFPMTNIYAVDLQIVDVRVSCGCVTAVAGAKLLKSRGSSYIDIVMDARKFTGPKSVNVYVTVGPEYTSTATLNVSANSRADVVFNPGQINLGIVAKGATPQQTVEVEYAGVLDWKITEAVSSSPFSVTVTESYRRTGQVGYKVLVALKPDAPVGILKQSIQLKTNDKASPVLNLLVEGNIQAALTVAPNVVAMDSLKIGQEKTQRVVLRANKPFKILGIDGLGNGISAPLPKAAATVQFVTVKCRPTKAGPLKQKLTIRTDLDGNTATVTVEGTVTE